MGSQTWDRPEAAEEIPGWAELNITVKGRRGTPTPGQPFPTGKRGEGEVIALPRGLEQVCDSGAGLSSDP